jgi:LemA protein
MPGVRTNARAKIFIVVLLFVFMVVGYFVSVRNNFVVGTQRVEQLLSGVEVQLQRRADLIPNLVNTVKGYAAHEEAVFSEVTAARVRLVGAKNSDELLQADGELTQALGKLFAVAEAYPELKANENFLSLQDEIAGAENRIAIARQDFNAAAAQFNAMLQMFPKNLVANLLGFEKFSLFSAKEGSESAVVVSFS